METQERFDKNADADSAADELLHLIYVDKSSRNGNANQPLVSWNILNQSASSNLRPKTHVLSCGLAAGQTLCKEPERWYYEDVGVDFKEECTQLKHKFEK